MYLLFALLFGLLFFPFWISFEINHEYLKLGWLKIKWSQTSSLSKQTSKVKHISVPKRKIGRMIFRAVRVVRLEFCIGYGCEMIDQSMYVYSALLVLLPTVGGILDHWHIQNHMIIQDFPVAKSRVKGMLEICLARLIIGQLRR